MTRSNTLPIVFKSWDECGEFGDMQFCDVRFTQDFGPFKKDEKVAFLVRMDADGQLKEYDEKGAVKRVANIKYTVV